MSTTRLFRLFSGLTLFGFSLALLVRAELGLDPWDVLHQGIAQRSGRSIGTVVITVGVLVLLLWLPLHQRPGIGTMSNVIVVGLVADIALALLPPYSSLFSHIALLVSAILLNAVGTGLYIGAGLGAGPRDGLMTGLAARGISIRAARTSIELSVLTVGWILGGTVGIGTLVFALSIGPLAQIFVTRLSLSQDRLMKEMAPCPIC